MVYRTIFVDLFLLDPERIFYFFIAKIYFYAIFFIYSRKYDSHFDYYPQEKKTQIEISSFSIKSELFDI